MPRAREMKSLKGLCLDDVEKAVNDWINRLLVDNVSSSGSTFIDLLEKGEDDELFKRVSNFFDILPSTLLLDIAKLIPFKFRQKERSKGNQLLWCYLEMLLSEGSAMVNQTAENVDGFLQVASKRCPLLKYLEIIRSPGCDILPYNLEPYLQRFQQLRVLNIGDGEIGDSCLMILGAFCKDLRELDVSFCSKVTDVGLASLCVSVDHLGNKNESKGLCKSIVKLWTNGTQVTNSGIQVAIKNLPELEFCDMASIQILAEMHQRDFRKTFEEQLEIPKYSFVYLKLKKKYSSPYIWGSLKMVLSLCSSLLKVHITAIAGFRNADLLSLISVERLCELIIKGCEDLSEITFEDGVTPLLEAKGRNLKELKLQDLGIPININTICELCPNLDVLALTGNRKYTSTRNSSRPKRIKLDIPKLKNLGILNLGSCCASCRGSNPNSCIPSENLAFLLLSPLLVEIDIRNCDTLTDDVLLTAAQSNPFLHLEELVLGGCHSITKRGVNVFMQENGIKKVLLIGCNKLTLDNIVTWKTKAIQNDWNFMLGCIVFRELPGDESD